MLHFEALWPRKFSAFQGHSPPAPPNSCAFNLECRSSNPAAPATQSMSARIKYENGHRDVRHGSAIIGGIVVVLIVLGVILYGLSKTVTDIAGAGAGALRRARLCQAFRQNSLSPVQKAWTSIPRSSKSSRRRGDTRALRLPPALSALCHNRACH
jgi:hypothetical protein